MNKEQYLHLMYEKFPKEKLMLVISHYVAPTWQEIDFKVNAEGDVVSRETEITMWATKKFAERFGVGISAALHNIDTGKVDFKPYMESLPDIGFDARVKTYNETYRASYIYRFTDIDDLKQKLCEVLAIKAINTIKKFKDLYDNN